MYSRMYLIRLGVLKEIAACISLAEVLIHSKC